VVTHFLLLRVQCIRPSDHSVGDSLFTFRCN